MTLKGHVAQPLRYPFTPGMRIRDLIPDRDALITPDFYRRKNLLVQVIEDDERLRLRDESDRAHDGSTRGGRSPADLAQSVGGSADARSDGAPASTERPRAAIAERGTDDRRARPSAARPRASAARIREEDRAAATRARRTPAALFDELNWDYATIERLNARPDARR